MHSSLTFLSFQKFCFTSTSIDFSWTLNCAGARKRRRKRRTRKRRRQETRDDGREPLRGGGYQRAGEAVAAIPLPSVLGCVCVYVCVREPVEPRGADGLFSAVTRGGGGTLILTDCSVWGRWKGSPWPGDDPPAYTATTATTAATTAFGRMHHSCACVYALSFKNKNKNKNNKKKTCALSSPAAKSCLSLVCSRWSLSAFR